MEATVAVCTWNRARLLDGLLQALAAQTVPPDLGWEVLVVDNGSTDDTGAVLARHAAALPLRGVAEPRPGHARARNRVLEEARGDLLLWLDDDVTVGPGWLGAWLAAAASWPGADFFGGPVEPWFARTPPAWLQRNLDALRGAFALIDLGRESRPFAPGEAPFGANMVMRRRAVGELRFDQHLGLVRGGQIRGEELEMIERLRARGADGVWVGTAPVNHLVPRQRMTARYVWRYFEGFGRTSVRRGLYGLADLDVAPEWMRVERRGLVRLLLSSLVSRRRDWVPLLIALAQRHGQIEELAVIPRAQRGRPKGARGMRL